MKCRARDLCVVLMVFALVGCRDGRRIEEAAATIEAGVQATLQPAPSPLAPEPTAGAPVAEKEVAAIPVAPEAPAATTTGMEEHVSITGLFNIKVPAGWSTEEAVPGANFVMANSEAALEHYSSGSAVESGDFVLNVGFLPLALLQEKDLSHLGFQFEASPEIFLQSLLPLFRIGDDPAGDIVGEAVLVSLRGERDAGMLALSDAGREGLILVFEVGDGVIAFVSAIGFPGETDAFQETVYAVAAEVVFSGAQDALYGALYGG